MYTVIYCNNASWKVNWNRWGNVRVYFIFVNDPIGVSIDRQSDYFQMKNDSLQQQYTFCYGEQPCELHMHAI